VGVQVRIDAPRYRACALYDGHCHPFLSQRFKDWHARAGREVGSEAKEPLPLPLVGYDTQLTDDALGAVEHRCGM
jgi:hypothetical protein